MFNVVNFRYRNGNSIRIEYSKMKEIYQEIKSISAKEWKEIEKITFYRYDEGTTSVIAAISVYE